MTATAATPSPTLRLPRRPLELRPPQPAPVAGGRRAADSACASRARKGRATRRRGPDRPAFLGGFLRSFGQDNLGLLQVDGIESLGEPAQNVGQELMGLLALAPLLPQTGQDRHRS
jgi:hypothetical protein